MNKHNFLSNNSWIGRSYSYLSSFLDWLLLSSFVGAIVGAIASLFNIVLQRVTEFRVQNEWAIWLLPFAGIIIAFLYRDEEKDPLTTNLVVQAVRAERHLPAKMAPIIFIATSLTHAFGGSAGREGAALQLGGSLGQMIGDTLQSNRTKKQILIMCGMSAAFSALFGTPLAAAVFSLELANIGMMNYFALFPCAMSSLIAVSIARCCGIHAEVFPLENFTLTFGLSLKVIILAILCGSMSIAFCFVLHKAEHLIHHTLPNRYIRVFVSGCVVIALTLLIGSRDYLGAGMNIIEHAVAGHAVLYAFALKLLFTAITLGGGFKGGEIVPALFVGATFGFTVAALLNMPASLGAALGMIALFCGVTNCPISSLLLAFELFTFSSPGFFLLAVTISYMLSGNYSLYSTQRIIYAKTEPVMVNRSAH
ncbi:MAG: chloride channel protein [Oscillospiraceae bacterium]|nr:chloride channel protein [Oscillospiraceae bacterium]